MKRSPKIPKSKIGEFKPDALLRLSNFEVDLLLIHTAFSLFFLMLSLSNIGIFLISMTTPVLVLAYNRVRLGNILNGALTIEPVKDNTSKKEVSIVETKSGSMRTMSFLRRYYILHPEWSKKTQNHEMGIEHERCHIERGDTSFFCYFMPVSLILSFYSIVYFLFVGPNFGSQDSYFEIIFGTNEGSSSISQAISYVVSFSSAVNVILLFLSARDREILCDQKMIDRFGDQYFDFIRNNASYEKSEKNGILFYLSRLFTHPSFEKRLKLLGRPELLLHSISLFTPIVILSCFSNSFLISVLLIYSGVNAIDTVGLNTDLPVYDLINPIFYLSLVAGGLLYSVFIYFCLRLSFILSRTFFSYSNFSCTLAAFTLGILVSTLPYVQGTELSLFSIYSFMVIGLVFLSCLYLPALGWLILMTTIGDFSGVKWLCITISFSVSTWLVYYFHF